MTATLGNVSPGDLILYGANSGNGIYFFLALVYRQATEKELSDNSLTSPAVMVVPMSSPNYFPTNPASIPPGSLIPIPLARIAAVYKASPVASDLFAAAAPYAIEPWS